MLYCQGFCAALKEHHVSEDVALFPELSVRHPTLIMESHFRYEERQLLDVLSALDLVADPRALLGPF